MDPAAIPDPSQQPITAADPRVAQILAMIQGNAKAAAAPDVAQAAPIPIPQQPQPQAPLPSQPLPAQAQEMPQPLQASPPNAADAPQPSKPGPVKSFLIALGAHLANGVQGGSDALLKSAGLPTSYEKQQNAANMAIRQQQADAVTGWRNSQGSLAQSKADQLDAMNQPFVVPNDPSIPPQLRGQTITQGAWQGLSKVFGVNQGKLDVQSEKDAALLARAQALVKNGTSFQHVAGTTAGQNTFANYNPKTGEYTDLSGKVLTDFKPASKAMQGALGGFGPAFAATRTLMAAYNENPALLPVLAPMLAKMLAPDNPNAAATFASIPNGQPLSPVNGAPVGLKMPSAPTGATRSQAQVAQRVLSEIPRIQDEVTATANNLGPVKGRLLVRYLLGGVGSTGDATTDQSLAKLRTDLTFMGSGSAKFHINSVRQAEAYENLLDAGKSPAEAIKGTLDSMKEWATSAAKQQRGFGETDTATPNSTVAPDPFAQFGGKAH